MINTNIIVSCNESYYKTNSAISGKIVFSVNENVSVKKLTLFFVKTEKVEIEHIHDNNNIYLHSNNDVNYKNVVFKKQFNFNVETIFPSKELMLGKYEVPFTFVLSDKDCASTNLCNYYSDVFVEVENLYELYAVAECFKKETVTSEKYKLNIYQELDSNKSTNCMLNVKNLFFAVKRVPFTVELDKCIYFTGDYVNVNLNFCGKKIKSGTRCIVHEVFVYKNCFIRSRVVMDMEIVSNNFTLKLSNNCASSCIEKDFEVHNIIEIKFRYFKNIVSIKKNINVIQLGDIKQLPEQYHGLDGILDMNASSTSLVYINDFTLNS